MDENQEEARKKPKVDISQDSMDDRERQYRPHPLLE
jgi:hypothetical protein